MLEAKSFLDHTNFFSPNEYEKNNEIVSAFVIPIGITSYTVRFKNFAVTAEIKKYKSITKKEKKKHNKIVLLEQTK